MYNPGPDGWELFLNNFAERQCSLHAGISQHSPRSYSDITAASKISTAFLHADCDEYMLVSLCRPTQILRKRTIQIITICSTDAIRKWYSQKLG
ncbi:hypothetical protein CVT25_000497 [Psilocybe cyanescens]|uniref:Uncharacterized protein n=1 Tax=Psilocybe cyanescens TaxID=93625 RepID=A0A409XW96_PSICY|nr:hypothetical protein CVT25_000497 [Psilocybe cyanescens]